ncbi:MAG: HDOD domain-containing protein [Desulfotignum sp.]|jgi:EAL and modified HD-GYP domain-containing signal transduction protein|nr:HDOD domain-containing protein [Desulfotignum sp.]
MDIFVARQPVFTARKKVFGYELLFRTGLENVFPEIDGDSATAGVLANTFFSFGLDKMLAGRPGLINFTASLLRQKTPLLFPENHIIIEVLEDVSPDPDIIAALDLFKKKGYRIALDDFVYDEKFESMMARSSMIKFDLIATPLESLVPVIKDIQNRFPMTLLAEKVETHAQFDQAKEMGFELFQGYFFSKPEILSSRDLSADQITKIKLINAAAKAELDLDELEALIKKNISVSFKLLKFINSAYFSRSVAIDTIHDAMVVLGSDALKKFINIVVAADLNEDKPNELIRSSVIRARMCEHFAGMTKTGFTPDEMFTMGLFSRMDAILDMPMADILKQITLSDKFKDALLGRDKIFQRILALVTCFERGRWDHKVYTQLQGSRIIDRMPGFYQDALAMADAFFV